jgi:hypothetical protein
LSFSVVQWRQLIYRSGFFRFNSRHRRRHGFFCVAIPSRSQNILSSSKHQTVLFFKFTLVTPSPFSASIGSF